jgi:hypothetical protein
MNSMIRGPRALLAGVLAIGLLSPLARADLVITVQEDSSTPVVLLDIVGSPTSDLSGGASATLPDYKVTVQGGESDQNDDTLSELLSSATSITRTTGGASHVLHISIVGTGYTMPTTPPNVGGVNSIGGTTLTLATPSTDSLSFQGTVTGASPPAFTPPLTPVINAVGGWVGVSQSAVITTLSSPFNILQTLTLTLNGNGDKINYSASTDLTSLTAPEPSSLVLAGLGGLGLLGYGLRRRKAQGV